MAPLTLGKTRGQGLLQCEEEQKKKIRFTHPYKPTEHRREQNLVYTLSQQTIQVES